MMSLSSLAYSRGGAGIRISGAGVALVVLVSFLAAISPASAQSWFDAGWQYRRPVTVGNPSGTTLTDFQVKVLLTSAFDFTKAQIDGSDLRVTDSDGTTPIPFWVASWNAGTQQATLWVKVPGVPVAGTTIYLYYGNAAAGSASSGDDTFEFFDDFEGASDQLGYWPFGPAQTVMVQDQAWESSAPHSLSAVRAPVGAPYTYYGYYGLVGCGGIGMAGSDDLVHWTKFATNPLILSQGERWPIVVEADGLYWMVHTRDYCGNSHLVYRTSVDASTWSGPTQIVPPDGTWTRRQNPNLFHDPVDDQFYLYWFEGNGSVWNIMARTAPTVGDLVLAPDILLLSSPVTLAAPNMMYRDGVYFLSTEISEGGLWKVRIYSGGSPLGPFTILPGNPVLSDGCACMFQTPFGDTAYEYYCKLTGGVWTVDLRLVDLSGPRLQVTSLDLTKWTPFGGSWTAESATQHDGTAGHVAQGSTGTRQILKSSFTGTDYVLEAYGRQLAGRVWGLGVRATTDANLYSINLYEDLDATNNLYVYTWVGGGVTTSSRAAVGTINLDAWYKLSVKVHGSAVDVYFNDATTPAIQHVSSQHAAGSVALYGESGSTLQVDDVLVRKYATLEPTTTVGDETPQIADYVVAEVASGTCIAQGECETVPVMFHRADASEVRGVSVRFQLSPELALCVDSTSIHQGTWLDDWDNKTFLVVDNGGGSYTVDQAILGESPTPCGITTGGELFTMDLKGVGDGTGTITVTNLIVRDCLNAPVPGVPGLPAGIAVDTTLPVAVADLAAVQQLHGNDRDGTTKILLSLTDPLDADSVMVFRKGFGFYPEYDDDGGSVPTAPTSPGDAVTQGWTLTGVTASGADEPATRDFWYHVAFTRDECGNVSPVSNMTTGTLNYHLGDVSDGVTQGQGDNLVDGADISLLGGHYGINLLPGDSYDYLDVGPTATHYVDGLPATDDKVNFEDLMIFAINFAHVDKARPSAPREVTFQDPTIAMRVETSGEDVLAHLVLSDNAEVVKGMHALVAFDRAQLELAGVARGELLDRQSGAVFLGQVNEDRGVAVDAALLGGRQALAGNGEVAVVKFRRLAGTSLPSLGEAALRDASNRPAARRPVEVDVESAASPAVEATLPARLELVGARPNPFGSSTEIVFRLPSPTTVSLRIYDVTGRLVRVLADGAIGAGEHVTRWDGRTSDGSVAASGIYFYTFRAEDLRETRKLIHAR